MNCNLNLTSWIDFNHLKVYAETFNVKSLKNVKQVHEKKLFQLGVNAVNESLNADKVVFNYSNVILSQKLENLLVKGLRFGIPPSKLNFTHFFLSFENLSKSLSGHKPSGKFR